MLLPFCRLKPGEIWEDGVAGHRVGCLDASSQDQVLRLLDGQKGSLVIQDRPTISVAFAERPLCQFIDWCARWVGEYRAGFVGRFLAIRVAWRRPERWFSATAGFHGDDAAAVPTAASLPCEISGDTALRRIGWRSGRSCSITPRGVRPSMLTPNTPTSRKFLRGYYKEVGGAGYGKHRAKQIREHPGRKRLGRVQQVFYRMEENVSGCYAQKPIKSTDRIIRAS